MWKKIAFQAVLILAAGCAYAEAPACLDEIARHFFSTDTVSEALAMHGVGQANWILIERELAVGASAVPKIVRERAKQLIPNPLDPPYDSEATRALLEQALLDVMLSTLNTFHVTNTATVEDMYRYIRDKQEAKFNRCFPPPQPTLN